MRVGVDARAESERVSERLLQGGWERTQRVEGDGYVALAFARGEDQRAVRLVTSRGVVVALDSHEPDGVRPRHGTVRLLEDGAPPNRVGDARPEIVVARDEADGSTCLAVLTVDDDGRATVIPDESDAVSPGACPSRLEDIDADGVVEALVTLRWPHLVLGESRAPTVEAPLVFARGGFRASAAPVAFLSRERAAREAALVTARGLLDVVTAARLAVELAALAHLSGASPAAQVERFDEAMSGMVLPEAFSPGVASIRRSVAAGWPAPEP